ncbi:iron-sulfur cluster biosynthesis family protein [Saccharibacillus sacchari]|uniref:Iron-sulfur cluster biosynthesis family protein n=1 Tax=Saccharibacillus sacchari TaxID=456493 RepID=A0ACC6PF46_9BACL
MSISFRMTVSPDAQTLLDQKFQGRPGYLRIAYDNEGCGCSLSGAIALWLVDETTPSDLTLASDSPITFIMNKNDSVYLDQNLFITISGFDKSSVRLASDGQSFGSSIRIEDHRTASEARF